MTYSKIEWTEETWNPLAGCTVKSPGCTNCYAMKTAWRFKDQVPKYRGTVKQVNGKPVWTGKINFDEKALLAPLNRKKPTVWFVNSMSDLFHEDVPDEWIDKVFAVMALCPQHIFQVLTKRADRMRLYFNNEETYSRILYQAIEYIPLCDDPDGIFCADGPDEPASSFSQWPLPNVWLGVSVEDQKRADERIPDLLATPAAVRFLSMEPLLGPVNLALVNGGWYYQNVLTGKRWHDAPEGMHSSTDDDGGKIDWVIVGGESGPDARPMHPKWARTIRDQCAEAKVPFFFKQWGEWSAIDAWEPWNRTPQCARRLDGSKQPDETWAKTSQRFKKIGKKSAGRRLDGVTHDAMPAGLRS